MFKLSQTLAGNWVITLPNPEEAGWETQLAEFNTASATPGSAAHDIIVSSAVSMLASLVSSFPDRGYEVQSHDADALQHMLKLVMDAIYA